MYIFFLLSWEYISYVANPPSYHHVCTFIFTDHNATFQFVADLLGKLMFFQFKSVKTIVLIWDGN